MNYTVTPAKKLLASKSKKYKNLHFDGCVDAINLPFNAVEINEISSFLDSFGNVDLASQKAKVLSFVSFLNQTKSKYTEKYKSTAKLYISLGIFSGIVLSLVLI